MVLNPQYILLGGSVLFLISIFASRAAYRFGVPVLLLFLIIGMVFGSDGVGIQFNNASTAQFIGVVALSMILFSGGMDTKYSEIKPVILPGIVLASVGVLITALIVGVLIYFITNQVDRFITLSLPESMLLAAVMSSTDSASVFSILRSKGLHLKENLRPLLELESGSNDPMAYMLTLLFIGAVQAGEINVTGFIIKLIVQLVIGALCGYFLGKLIIYIAGKIKLPTSSQYNILFLTFAFFVYSSTEFLYGNGFLAVYISGLVLGNSKLPNRENTEGFFDSIAWFFQLIMFLSLGLLVNPSELPHIMGIGLAVTFVMVVIARPAAIFLCLAPFKHISNRAKHYVSWVGLKGAVPIIFATYPLTAGLENAGHMFNIVFFITLVSLLVQGTTVNFAAEKLKLSNPSD